MFVNTQDAFIIATVAVVTAYIYRKQQPPSHDDIQYHINKSDEYQAKSEVSFANAKTALTDHVAAKRSEIDGLSAAIGEANASIEKAKTLLYGK